MDFKIIFSRNTFLINTSKTYFLRFSFWLLVIYSNFSQSVIFISVYKYSGSLQLIEPAASHHSSELSAAISPQQVCLVSHTVFTPNPGELVDHIALSHLHLWPACFIDSFSPCGECRGRSRSGQENSDMTGSKKQKNLNQKESHFHRHLQLSDWFCVSFILHPIVS